MFLPFSFSFSVDGLFDWLNSTHFKVKQSKANISELFVWRKKKDSFSFSFSSASTDHSSLSIMVCFFSFIFLKCSFFYLVPFCLLYHLPADLILISISLYFVASHNYLWSSLFSNWFVIRWRWTHFSSKHNHYLITVINFN